MPHPAPEDRQLAAVVRRLLSEATDEAEGPLRGIADHMITVAGPPEHTKPSARRYARAIIDAAVVDARLEAAAELVATAEWYARHAEAVAERLITRLELGDQQVVATGLEDEISDDINALVSLADGRVWVRDATVYQDRTRSKYWTRAETSERSTTHYEWPLEGGPFLALPEQWYLRSLVDTARRRDTDEQRIRDLTRSRKGYEYPYTGGLAKMLEAVLIAEDRRRSDLRAELQHERQKLYDIRRTMADTDLTPAEQHARMVGILEGPAHDAPPPAVPRCPACGHAPHGVHGCFNMASDGDCDCKGAEG